LERPFIVPWTEIYSQWVPGWFGPRAQLSFGADFGSMKIKAATWESLVNCVKARPPYD